MRKKEKREMLLKNPKFEENSSEGDGESTCSDSDAENSQLFSEELDKDWFNTYNAIKNNDPSIYDSSKKFYKNSYADTTRKSNKKEEASENLYEAEVKYITNPQIENIDLEVVGHHEKQQDELKNKFAEALREGVDDENFFNQEDEDEEEEEEDERIKTDKMEEDAEGFLRNYVFSHHDEENDDDDDDQGDEQLDEMKDKDEEEEDELKKAAMFEHKYNFRFEEPDDEFIKTYPRTVAASVRKLKRSRSEKRKNAKKKKEMLRKEDDGKIEKVRSMQMKECMKMMKKLEGDEMYECDFDPSIHDSLMEKHFGRDFYNERESEKPVFKDEEEEDDDDDDDDEKLITPSKKEPPFVKASKKKMEKYQRMLDDLEKKDSDFMPFEYKNVHATDYGMSAQEILMCDDKELNAWLPIRKIIASKTDEEEKMLDVCMRSNIRKKKKTCPSLYSEETIVEGEKKRKRKKEDDDAVYADENAEIHHNAEGEEEDEEDNGEEGDEEEDDDGEEGEEEEDDDEEEDGYVKKSKFKKKQKNQKVERSVEVINNINKIKTTKLQKDNLKCSNKYIPQSLEQVTEEDISVKKKKKRLSNKCHTNSDFSEKKVETKSEPNKESYKTKEGNKSLKYLKKKQNENDDQEKKKIKNVKKKRKMIPMMSEDRLKAYQIQSKKFKYHYLPKVINDKKKQSFE